MTKTSPLLTIGRDHPLYSRVVELLGLENSAKAKKQQELRSAKSFELDWAQLTTDYNNLGSQEILAFLAFGSGVGARISQGLTRRGLSRSGDFLVFSFNVLSVDTLHMLARAPTEEIPEGEFANYACISGELYPDPKKHPNIAAMDKAIPRRSNHSVTSDSLPVITSLRQIYLLKTSAQKAKMLGKAGRPKKEG